MPTPTEELTPPEAARWAVRAGLPLAADRHQAVAATANHIHSVVAVLRELDFADTPPTPPSPLPPFLLPPTPVPPSPQPTTHHTPEENHHAAV